jgi:hypothetical protein
MAADTVLRVQLTPQRFAIKSASLILFSVSPSVNGCGFTARLSRDFLYRDSNILS